MNIMRLVIDEEAQAEGCCKDKSKCDCLICTTYIQFSVCACIIPKKLLHNKLINFDEIHIH